MPSLPGTLSIRAGTTATTGTSWTAMDRVIGSQTAWSSPRTIKITTIYSCWTVQPRPMVAGGTTIAGVSSSLVLIRKSRRLSSNIMCIVWGIGMICLLPGWWWEWFEDDQRIIQNVMARCLIYCLLSSKQGICRCHIYHSALHCIVYTFPYHNVESLLQMYIQWMW